QRTSEKDTSKQLLAQQSGTSSGDNGRKVKSRQRDCCTFEERNKKKSKNEEK
ncbi:hypothetical protein CEXT_217461, partial [Caerostris extrusa]